MVKYLIVDNFHEVYSDLTEIEARDLKEITVDGKYVIANKSARVAVIKKDKTTICILSYDKNLIKSSSLFNKYRDSSVVFLELFARVQEDNLKQVRELYRRLSHNLVTHTAHSQQEFQNAYGDGSDTIPAFAAGKLVEKVKKDAKQAAKLITQQYKINNAIKNELLVFATLHSTQEAIEIKTHIVHRVIMTVLYMFFPDFTDKNIKINLESSTVRASFDYRTFSVVLFHLFDNAAKYALEDQDIEIKIIEKADNVEVLMSMMSLKIDTSEKDKIFAEGYSGDMSIRTGKNGNGIGMWIVKELLLLNGADIAIEWSESSKQKKGDCEYQKNIFKINLQVAKT